MPRVIAGLVAVPLLLFSGVFTAAFLLPADRSYLLGPMIAVAMLISMVLILLSLPRIIRWRLESLFGRQGPWSPGLVGGAGWGSGLGNGFPGYRGPAGGSGRTSGAGGGVGDENDPGDLWSGPYGEDPHNARWDHCHEGTGESGGSSWAHHHGSAGSSSWDGSAGHGGSSGSDSSSSCGSDSSWSSSSSGSDSSSSGSGSW